MITKRRFLFLATIVLVAIGVAISKPTHGNAWAFDPDQKAPAPTYKLVVVIVVDQLRADFLTRFGDLFVDNGFKLLMERGAWFTNCRYEHGVTKTGPGHACIATGANPAVHGIVGNDWYEQADGKFVPIDCVRAPDARTIGLPGGSTSVGASPRRLLADTLADQLKAATPASRVLACSLKDTAAILHVGKAADGAYWWNRGTGLMITSDFYHSELPPWVRAFNDDRPADRYLNRTWTRIAPLAEYNHRCRRDDADYEWGARYGRTNTFPHRLSEPYLNRPSVAYYASLFDSPFGNELLLNFAKGGIEAMKLGRRGVTDLLLVSLSSNDGVGHVYGPYSHEVMDITLRTDRQLADFFKFLDSRVGLKNCLITLTSDHGACTVPEYAIEKKQGGGRITATKIARQIDQTLSKAFGKPAGTERYVGKVSMPWVYFRSSALQSKHVTADKLRDVLEKMANDEPSLAAVFLAEDIQRDDFALSAAHSLRSRVKASYYPGRSGDLYVHVAENWYAGSSATGHGSAHPYNTHVPLLLFGRGIKPGKYDTPSAPTDIAATLAKLLNIPPPSKSTGRILQEAVSR